MFRDPKVFRSLQDHGYCVTDHCLSPETLAIAQRLVDDHPHTGALDEPGYVHSLNGGAPPDISLAERARLDAPVAHELQQLVHPGEARIILAALQVKPSSPHSHLMAHQDFFLVDETSAYGLNAWTCLTEATAESGALYVLPGSHKYGNWRRVASLDDDLDGLHEVIGRHARLLTAAPGQVILMDHALIHGSLANTSGARRVAISSHIIPWSADRMLQRISDETPAGHIDFSLVPPDILDELFGAHVAGSQTHRAPIDQLLLTPRKLDLACRIHVARYGNPPGTPLPVETAC